MSIIRRWARKIYYNQSPIYQDPLFQKPGNQGLAAIHPRLFAAYCFKMNKQKMYSRQKIKEIVPAHFSKQDYWIDYMQKIIVGTDQLSTYVQSPEKEERAIIRQKFQTLLSKLFNKKITEVQFKQLCLCFEKMLINEQITDFDLLILDASFSTINQISQILSIKQETASQAVGNYSLQLIRDYCCRGFNHHMFQFVHIFNRIKERSNLPMDLNSLSKLILQIEDSRNIVQGKYIQLDTCLRKQIFGYMIWLLYSQQLGPFVSKFAFQHELFKQYYRDSAHIAYHLLLKIDISQSLKLSESVLLYEAAHQLQALHEIRPFSHEAKVNVEVQRKFRKIKKSIQLLLSRFEQKDFQDYQWISQLDEYQIDYETSQTTNLIKKWISKLISHPHFTLILPKEDYSKLMSLCFKIDELDLFEKVRKKIGKNQDIYTDNKRGLLRDMEKAYSNDFHGIQGNIHIYSIFQLKRIKKLSAKLTKKMDNLYGFFSSEDKHTLSILFTQLHKNHIQAQGSKPNHQLQKIFTQFKA